MTTLDAVASRAVVAARLLERAVHDPGPWWNRLGPALSPASRQLLEDGAVFTARFPAACWMEPEMPAELLCREDVMSCWPVRPAEEREFDLGWSVGAVLEAA